MTDSRAAGPRTPRPGIGLAWQFGGLLLAAIVASHLLVMAFLQRSGEIVHPISREQAVATLAAAYLLSDGMPDAVASATLAALSQGEPAAGGTRLWLAAVPEVSAFAMQPEEQAFARTLRQRLGLPDDVDLWVQLERTSGESARASPLSLAAWEPLRLRASVALPQGGWLNAERGLQGRYDWSRILALILPASILPVLGVGLWLAWRLVRPLRTLIQAAGRVRYGAELPALPIHGPREARALTAQFNALQQRIAQHRDTRTRLLAAISHDLRTPVTALRLQVELVDEDALRADLLASVAELQAMVEATLDYARADARVEDWQTVDIADLLHQLARRYRQLNQPVTLPDNLAPVPWRCRPLALRRALGNLIDNALRHAGSAELRLHAEATGLVLHVLDRGPGIPAERRERVFEPFEQADDARGVARTGLGLGLSIARNCIEMQDGSITLHDRAGGGLDVRVRLAARDGLSPPRPAPADGG